MPAGEGKLCWGFCFSLALTLQLFKDYVYFILGRSVRTRQCPDKWEQPSVGAVLEPSGSPALPSLWHLGKRSCAGLFLEQASEHRLCW